MINKPDGTPWSFNEAFAAMGGKMTMPSNAESGLNEAKAHGNTIHIPLWYPSTDNQQYIEIGLDHVRAADTIRIHYDLKRDGFVIEQNTKPGICGTPDCWVEVAFVKSWALDSEVNNGREQ